MLQVQVIGQPSSSGWSRIAYHFYRMGEKPEIRFLLPGRPACSAASWSRIAFLSYPSPLSAAELLKIAGLTPELFHLYFVGSDKPGEAVAVNDEDQDLLELGPGAKILFFRIDEVPLTADEKEKVLTHLASGDLAPVAHLLPRPPRLTKPKDSGLRHRGSRSPAAMLGACASSAPASAAGST